MCTNGNTTMRKSCSSFLRVIVVVAVADAVAVAVAFLISVHMCGLLRNAEFRTHIALFIRLIDSVWFVRNIYFRHLNIVCVCVWSFVSFRLIWFFFRFTMPFVQNVTKDMCVCVPSFRSSSIKWHEALVSCIHSITMHCIETAIFDNSVSRLRLRLRFRLRLNRLNRIAREKTHLLTCIHSTAHHGMVCTHARTHLLTMHRHFAQAVNTNLNKYEQNFGLERITDDRTNIAADKANDSLGRPCAIEPNTQEHHFHKFFCTYSNQCAIKWIANDTHSSVSVTDQPK